MTTTTNKWHAEKQTAIGRSQAIVARAKAENRDLTADEQAQVEADIALATDLTAKIKSAETVSRVLAGPGPTIDPVSGEVLTGMFNEQAKAGLIHAVKTRTPYRTEVKATITSGNILPSVGTLGAEGLHPNSQFPLSSLFRNQPADGPVQRYYRMTAGTADVVAEGTLKPDAGIAITPVDLPIAKIACTATFSDEMVEDAPYLVNYLSRELTAAVVAEENAQVLATFAATSNILTDSGPDLVDLIADAIAAQEAVSGLTPSAIILNPDDLATVRKAKASTAGTYVVDPLSTAPAILHGVRLVSTPATTAGTVYVVEASGVLIYRRSVLTVEVGTSGDDWSYNLRTARAEERMATAVLRPSAVAELTITPAPPG